MADELEPWIASLLRLEADEEKMTDKQMKILEAAVEVFAQKGYAAASTSEIAQRAGVAEGTIFRHYRTKKDLLISIIAPTMARLVAPFLLRDIEPLFASDYACFADFLRAVMENRLQFAVKNASVLKILLHEIPFHEELRRQFMHHLLPPVTQRVERIVTHFQSQGELLQMPPLALMRLMLAPMAGYILTRAFILPDGEWNDEEEIERAVQFIMHGLSTGRRVISRENLPGA